MAHPASLNLFDLLDLANSLSGGSLPVSAALIGLIAVAVLAIYCAERKAGRTRCRTRNARASAEQEARIDAGREFLHLDERDAVDRLIADVLKETAQQQILRRGVCPPDLHDVFEEGDRD